MALTIDTLLTTMRTVRALEPAPRLRIVFTTTAPKDSNERLFCRRNDVPIGLIGGHISGLGCGDPQPPIPTFADGGDLKGGRATFGAIPSRTGVIAVCARAGPTPTTLRMRRLTENP
jgi:hypothetical protein